ncbi:MAG: ATP phosphoribosyltransferase [Syntrophomonadaceae bacterium]|jgi:ATP phosphoribosyltransferase|nr:ATP phosphoribosyltransferase [Syntrophomonadaceae bacterium]
MNQDYLTVALCKGSLLKSTCRLFDAVDLPVDGIIEESRSMVFSFPERKIKYIMCRPTDVPTYVEQGAADLGVVGKDVIVEQRKDVFEMIDLGFGYCRFVVAGPERLAGIGTKDLNYKRVATKFPVVAESFFRDLGLQAEIIKLHGNVELAPIMGLADVIVDLVSTGKTLKENHLLELAPIMDSTARLICNMVSYRTKYDMIQPLLEKLNEKVPAVAGK